MSALRKIVASEVHSAAPIRFAIAPCSRGFVIVALKGQEARWVRIDEDPEMLVSQLHNQFPLSEFELMEDDSQRLIGDVVASIENSVSRNHA